MKKSKMSILGIAITKQNKNEGTLYVEYRECDKCHSEYRLYFRSEQVVEEAFQTLAQRLGNKPDEQDLCFNCQNQVMADQVMLPLRFLGQEKREGSRMRNLPVPM